jgi:hypothetical protein
MWSESRYRRGPDISSSIPQLTGSGELRTIGAAVHTPIVFYTVANNPTPAMRALRGQRMNGTLEAVERVRFTPHHDFKGFVVLVAADLARV